MSHVLQSATKHYQRLTGGAVGSLQHDCNMKSSPVALVVVVVVDAPSRVNVRLAAKGCASLTTVQPGVLLGSPSPRSHPGTVMQPTGSPEGTPKSGLEHLP